MPISASRNKQKPVNLMPQNDFEATLTGRILKWILTSFRVIVISVELIVICGFLSRFWLDIRNADLNDEIKQKEALIQSYLNFEKEFKKTQAKIGLFGVMTSPEREVAPLLTKVVTKLPVDTKLISITQNSKGIEIRASSLSEQSIAQFMANLSTIQEMNDIALTQIESRAESPLITFVLTSSSKISNQEETATEGSTENGS